MSQAQELALAPEELEPPLADLLETPLEVAAFLGGNGHQREAAGQVLEGLGGQKPDRRADQPRDLRVVTAGVRRARLGIGLGRSEEHTSELQSLRHLVCRLLLEKKNKKQTRLQM